MRLTDLTACIRQATPPAGMAAKIIAVDGGGGAGKSTLAQHLAAALGDAPIVPTDDFMDGPRPYVDWWQRLRDQVILPLSQNRPARYQRFDWRRHQLAEWHEVAADGYVILEGVTSSRREFRPHLAFSIWVDTPKHIRLERGVSRDGEHPRDQWHEWQSWDQLYYDRDRSDKSADLVLDGTKRYW